MAKRTPLTKAMRAEAVSRMAADLADPRIEEGHNTHTCLKVVEVSHG